MILIAIKNKLLGRSEITALVGSRIYLEGHLPQAPTYPAITFFIVSNPRKHNIDVASPRIQFDVWSKSKIVSWQIADEIKYALQRERGIFSGISVIQGVYLDAEDDYEKDTKIYRVRTDFKIIYKGA